MTGSLSRRSWEGTLDEPKNVCVGGYILGEDKLIFAMDITSLYNIIPYAKGLLALKHFFSLRAVNLRNTAPPG